MPALSKLIVPAASLLLTGCADSLPPEAACVPWISTPAAFSSNLNSPLAGCSNRENLKAMLADPADLESGRNLAPGDGAREALGVAAYRQGKTKPYIGNGAAGPGATFLAPNANAQQTAP